MPKNPIRRQLEQEGRILHNDWLKYTGGEVVFNPAKMSAESLQEMYEYAWNTFYGDFSKEVKMAKLYLKVIEKERQDGTFRRARLNPQRRAKKE